jgi:hypothetical protein
VASFYTIPADQEKRYLHTSGNRHSTCWSRPVDRPRSQGDRVFYRKARLACGGCQCHHVALEFPFSTEQRQPRSYELFVAQAARALDLADDDGCRADCWKSAGRRHQLRRMNSALSSMGNGKPKRTRSESSASSNYHFHSPNRIRAQSADGQRGNGGRGPSILRHSRSCNDSRRRRSNDSFCHLEPQCRRGQSHPDRPSQVKLFRLLRRCHRQALLRR